MRAFFLTLGLLWGLIAPLQAQVSGPFTYQVISGNSVKIRGYSNAVGGAVIIPATIAGLPVTSIGDQVFANRTGLTSISLPEGLTSLGYGTFSGCTRLTSLTLPEGLTTIGNYAFEGCTGLTSITLPKGLPTIDSGAFEGCTGLTSAYFLGNAPSFFDLRVFPSTAPGLTVYYLSTRTGFTNPTWQGYPSVAINESTYPAASWLLAGGLPYDRNLNEDAEGDGISLLMAYAFNLDPLRHAAGALPQPVLSGNTLSLTYFARANGITYTPETSTNLVDWTTAGVTLSALGTDGRRTATIPITSDTPTRLLRLEIKR